MKKRGGSPKIDAESVRATTELARLVMDFGEIDRGTYKSDAQTPESDTDHTVMLALIATAFAARFVPHLDLGKVTHYALVHDLVEVYAGDTSTLKISDEDRAAKESRERAALERIEAEFQPTFPWVPETIKEYESLESPEARYVKTLDKLMPKMTHVLNGSKLLRDHGFVHDSLKEHFGMQKTTMESTYGHDQPEVIELHVALSELITEIY